MSKFLEAYDPCNLEKWLNKKPYKVLSLIVSDMRVLIDAWLGMGFGKETASLMTSDEKMAFDTQPPLTFSQVSTKLAKNVLAVSELVSVGYAYLRPVELRIWNPIQDFDLQINITDDFDPLLFVRKHKSVPPLSILFALSKGFIKYATKMDFYWKLLARPEIREKVSLIIDVPVFSVYKTPPISKFIDDLIYTNHRIITIGQTGINYVNIKRKEHN